MINDSTEMEVILYPSYRLSRVTKWEKNLFILTLCTNNIENIQKIIFLKLSHFQFVGVYRNQENRLAVSVRILYIYMKPFVRNVISITTSFG